jgi:hypothetical protein
VASEREPDAGGRRGEAAGANGHPQVKTGAVGVARGSAERAACSGATRAEGLGEACLGGGRGPGWQARQGGGKPGPVAGERDAGQYADAERAAELALLSDQLDGLADAL